MPDMPEDEPESFAASAAPTIDLMMAIPSSIPILDDLDAVLDVHPVDRASRAGDAIRALVERVTFRQNGTGDIGPPVEAPLELLTDRAPGGPNAPALPTPFPYRGKQAG
jgi:hypothetical protein